MKTSSKPQKRCDWSDFCETNNKQTDCTHVKMNNIFPYMSKDVLERKLVSLALFA